MSLRYGRLFDATVRDEYDRALTLAKAQLGPVLPGDRTQLPLAGITGGNWQDAPLIKARLAGGYCLRTAAQGACAYANICEHCPNFRSERQLPAGPAAAARRRRSARRRRPGPRLGRGSRPPPPPHRTTRHAHHPSRCQLTATSRPGSRPPAPSSPPPGSPSPSRGSRPRRDQPDHPLPAGRPARRHRGTPRPRPRRHHPVRPGHPDRPAPPQPRSHRRQSPPPRGNTPPPRTHTPRTREVAPRPSRRLVIHKMIFDWPVNRTGRGNAFRLPRTSSSDPDATSTHRAAEPGMSGHLLTMRAATDLREPAP